jgi:hypothetical protein
MNSGFNSGPWSITRRAIIQGAIGGLTSYPLRAGAQDVDEVLREEQRGDVSAAYETLTYRRSAIQALYDPSLATFEPRAPDFKKLVLDAAEPFRGFSRDTQPDAIKTMLELFELSFCDEHGKFVPFCASGLAYIVALGYCKYWKRTDTKLSTLRSALADIEHHHFFPSPSVRHMLNVADAKNRWKPKTAMNLPDPGWIVIYDFGKGADHVGLVLNANASGLETFECNTSGVINGNQRNGGVITIKNRKYTNVRGYINTGAIRAV